MLTMVAVHTKTTTGFVALVSHMVTVPLHSRSKGNKRVQLPCGRSTSVETLCGTALHALFRVPHVFERVLRGVCVGVVDHTAPRSISAKETLSE